MGSKTKELSSIDRGLTVEGTISSSGQLVIKGSVKGTLVGETVVIAEEGSVDADAKVSNITIGGKFEGEVRASGELIILSSGSCTGKVICKDLVVEKGGKLNAEVNCVTSQDTQPSLIDDNDSGQREG